MTTEAGFPQLRQVVLDCTDARALAEFYRRLLGLATAPGTSPPQPVRRIRWGRTGWCCAAPQAAGLAFQQVAELPEATWPDGPLPQQLHLDLTVPTRRTSMPSTSERWRSAPGCCTTAPTTRRSRCACTPTRRRIRSASSSRPRPGALML